jgi:hypothetical protein
MQFDKISLFYVAPDASLRVKTTVSANGQSCEIDGTPMIEVTKEIVQLGCIRMTKAALMILYNMSQTCDGLLQSGDYKTADPNTRRPQCCEFHKTGGHTDYSCGGDNGAYFHQKQEQARREHEQAESEGEGA